MKSLFNRTLTLARVTTCASVILAACVATFNTTIWLEHRARLLVSSAQSNPNVAGEARADLVTAVAALNQGDALLKEGKPAMEVDHQAYIAERFGLAAQRGADFAVSAEIRDSRRQ